MTWHARLTATPFRDVRSASLTIAVFLLTILPAQSNEPAYNPRRSAEDIVLPMPGGFKMVFVRVPVPGSGHWGNADRRSFH